MKKKFEVEGMTCSACSAAVEKAVRRLDGVSDASVNLLSKSMVVEYDDGAVDTEKIKEAVSKAGYSAEVFENEKTQGEGNAKASIKEDERGKNTTKTKKSLIASVILLIALMYISMGHMLGLPLPSLLQGAENAVIFAFLQFIITIPVLILNRKYYINGFRALLHRAPNMDSLIAIGTTAAVVYGVFAIFMIGYGLGHNQHETVHSYMESLYFETAAMIVTLVSVGKYIEERSKGKTSDAVKKLLDLSPKTATVLRNGLETEIPVDDIVAGDIIIIKPGGRIPVDGVITEGNAVVDQSALTGESVPLEKSVGDALMSASINKTGSFRMKATKVGADTTLAKIIALVEDAGATKAPIAKLADRVSGIFVPIVIAIAFISSVLWLVLGHTFEFSLSIGISVLVISCPCALGLATPVAIMVATGRNASKGILIKSAEALEIAHAIDTVVLDKTGTITEGKPSVTDIIPLGKIAEDRLAVIAASLEKQSEHPLAQAIVDYAVKNKYTLLPTESFVAIPGMGISAIISEKKYHAGNATLMREKNIDISAVEKTADKLSAEGKTPMFFAFGNELIGVVAVADTIKETSISAIQALKKMNLDIVMLTGDNAATAEAIRKQLDIDKVISDVLPSEKESVIRSIQEDGKKVAMVGDGINDSPALVRADVGIAIGAGTDIAIESAGIVLMKSDLQDAAELFRYSRETIKNIKQNLFWAFFYNTLGIPLAAGLFYPFLGWTLNPMIGAAAMSISSIFVVTNALRLYRK